ncbi:response regulator [Paenibacillus piri]|uniref:Response regulator n=1 Tax=Paenibacillus piri TaxID=2547395 RepID=A0A4R5K7F0_9BACL|nr:response regulator [Paenibacillus piri]TDF91021.1 response regulator [Paenibacillus piri]
MYKVIIIDDDSIIRKGLTLSIPWEQHGFGFVTSARDGEEGLKLVEELQPHLIITDIRMPFMDGFELANAVKARFPEIKIIMLTSYDEFEFAKRALQLKVFDYLMKPVDNQVLVDTAKRAIAELEYEKEIEQKVIEGLPLLRQRFFEQWIKGKLSDQEIYAASELLKLHLPDSRYVTIVLRADDYCYSEYENRFGQEMLKYCILNAAEEIIRTEYRGLVFDSQDDEVVIVYYDDADKSEIEHKAFEAAENIRTNIEKYLKTTVTAGIGFVYDNRHDVCLSYRDAKSAVEFRHMLGTNRVLMIGDTGLPPADSTQIELSGMEKELVLKVRLGLEKEAITILGNIEAMIMNIRFVSLSQVRLLGVEITLLLFKELEEWAVRHGALRESGEAIDFYTYYSKLQRLQTVQEIFQKIRELTVHLVEVSSSYREHQMKSKIHQAIAFMETNYAKEGLSLQDVAGSIYISPTYLSILFKKEKNISFGDYLLKLRMKAAVELLRMSDLKTYEIAEKVGYSNPQYFSSCFKKFTGYSPTEYKHYAN